MRSLMLFLSACAWAALAPLLSGSGDTGNRIDVGNRMGAGTMDGAAAGATAGTRTRGPGSAADLWPSRWQGRPLRPLALTPIETRFAGTFPGAMARFTDGSQEILFRRVARPTRKLHPASDCLRASGYTIEPLPAETAGPGRIWSRLAAMRKGERIEVREMVVAGDGTFAEGGVGGGESWTDVSAWYWSALWGRSAGPWTAITISRRSK